MKRSIILGVVGCLFSTSLALATPVENVRFVCSFSGVQLRKEPVACLAQGRFDRNAPRNKFVVGDNDQYLTVMCGNSLVVDDVIQYGIFGREGDHVLTHDHGDDDDFVNIKLLSVTPFTAAINIDRVFMDGFDGGTNKASLTVGVAGAPLSLFGSCHFRTEGHHHDVPPPPPAPAPLY